MSKTQTAKTTDDLDSNELDALEMVLLAAKQDGVAYGTNDVKGAVKKAAEELLKSKMEELQEELQFISGLAEKQLRSDWRKSRK